MDTFRVPVDRDDRAAEFTGEWFAPTALSLIFTGDTWRLESGECQFMEGGYKFTGHEIRHVDPVRSSGSRCPDEDNTDIVNAANIMLRTRTIITSNDELRLLNERGDDLLAAQR